MQQVNKSIVMLLLGLVWFNQCYSAEEVIGWDLTDEPLIVRGGTVIDVRNGDLIRDVVILIRGDRIESINDERSLPTDATVLDASGKYIIPGLIDAHVHYKNFSGPLYLNHGVTTVVSLGDTYDWIRAQKEGIRRGIIFGPRLYHSTENVDGSPENMSDVIKEESRLIDHHRFLDDAEEASAAMGGYVRDGVDAVKIYDGLDTAQLVAIVEEANKADIPVIGHFYDVFIAGEVGGHGIEHTKPVAHALLDENYMREAMKNVRPGQDVEPESFMDLDRIPEVVEYMIDHDLYLNPTLRGYDGGPGLRDLGFHYEDFDLTFNNWALRFIPIEWRLANLKEYQEIGYWNWRDLTEYEINLHQQGLENAMRFVKAFSDAGGKIYAGTDSANMSVPGLSLHQELQLLVVAGLSPLKALQAATITPAELMRMSERLGAVEVGKTGDLVILDANPLEDIRNARKIWRIVSRGKVFDGKYDANFKNPIPRLTPLASSHFFPPPRIRITSPRKLTLGSRGEVITVHGTGFNPYSFIQWNGENLQTEFVSDRELKASISAELLKEIGTITITVENPDFAWGSAEARGASDILHLGWMESMRDNISNEFKVLVAW
jgi:imidazolonepropionase-like amidohydrolase